ncbi:hypothetical protein RFI_26703, partial [Reticulomyxa filosa]
NNNNNNNNNNKIEKSKRNAIQEDKEHEPEEYEKNAKPNYPQINVPRIVTHAETDISNMVNDGNTSLSVTDHSILFKRPTDTEPPVDNHRAGGTPVTAGTPVTTGSNEAPPQQMGPLSDSTRFLHEPIEPSTTMTQSVFSYGAFINATNPPAEKSEAQMGGGVTMEKIQAHPIQQSGTFVIEIASDDGTANVGATTVTTPGIGGTFQTFSLNNQPINAVETRFRGFSGQSNGSITENETLATNKDQKKMAVKKMTAGTVTPCHCPKCCEFYCIFFLDVAFVSRNCSFFKLWLDVTYLTELHWKEKKITFFSLKINIHLLMHKIIKKQNHITYNELFTLRSKQTKSSLVEKSHFLF